MVMVLIVEILGAEREEVGRERSGRDPKKERDR